MGWPCIHLVWRACLTVKFASEQPLTFVEPDFPSIPFFSRICRSLALIMQAYNFAMTSVIAMSFHLFGLERSPDFASTLSMV